ncbi:ubiquitin carboxyl-terminal hydrolase 29 [Echinops telfairi]|uniref:Ubiquitin carboxyl-terminal hydrolase 29 n=1 Tax=Echinops telfairi TaxID=9371 RepID=A0AC55D988_ECHTE|nr:ubiquitin carboxyl-terminal hydrolase 29 [Echinops telfairi]
MEGTQITEHASDDDDDDDDEENIAGLDEARAGRISLHVTFQNDFSLHIEELSCREAEKLKMFLDRDCRKTSRSATNPDRDCEPSGAQNEPPWNESQLPGESPPEQSGPGFPNMGNTCYMNAILQSLFAVPSFADGLTRQGIPWEMLPAGAFSLGLRQLLVFKDLCDVETKKEFLVDIQRSISQVSDIYSSNTQNDAQEFLGHCLSQLKEDMEKLQSTGQGVRETADGQAEPQVLAAQAAPRDFPCPVRANFEVELQCSIICKACGEVVCKTDLSNYLSISLSQEQPGAWSLQDSLDFFFRAEELEYKCGKCKHGRSVGIQNVSRLPRVLIVHLKRYILDACHLLVKDSQSVSIPKYLILSSHCSEDCRGPLLSDSQARREETQSLNASQDGTSGARNHPGLLPSSFGTEPLFERRTPARASPRHLSGGGLTCLPAAPPQAPRAAPGPRRA